MLDRIVRKLIAILRIHHPEMVLMAPESIQAPLGFETKVLSADDLRGLGSSRAVSYGDGDISRIDQGVAICIAAFSGNRLAGICWYAIRAYPHSTGLVARVHADYICGYGLQVMPDFRGQGVRAVLVAKALDWIRQNGRKGLLAAINFDNKLSIHSAKKMGYKEIGYSYFCRWLPVLPRVKSIYHLDSTQPSLFVRQFRKIQSLGVFNYLSNSIYEIINRLIEFRLLLVNYFPPSLSNELSGSWLSGESLVSLENIDMGMHYDWLETAVSDKQQAAVWFEGKTPVSYFWFSDTPVHTSSRYTTQVSAEYFYGYKAYTHPDMRGRGLLFGLIQLASHQAYIQGKKGIITHVEINNFASRRAHARAQAKIVGFHILFKMGPFKFTLNSPGCRRYGSCLLRRD